MTSSLVTKLADRQIMGLLYGVMDRALGNFQDVAAEFDLTAPQARALLYLGVAAPMRALADHLSCDASNITGIADRLETRGLVRRGGANQDRRVKLLVLTPEGVRIREQVEQRLAETSPFMAGLSDSERAKLQELLSKIVDRRS
jgi:MarR family transcriptional regulator, organic hydroperoxide resistance regulator